jgi:uncharacterized membrane-anchored protein
MKGVLQIFFGFALGVAGIIAAFYLGLLVNGQPGLRTAILALLLLGLTQWISFVAFRRHVVTEVLVGVVLCAGVASWLMFSSHSFFWETRYPDGSSPITWRSALVLLVLLALTQAASFVIFQRLRPGRPSA